MKVKINPDAKIVFDGYLGAIGIDKKTQLKIKTKDEKRQFLLWLANEGDFCYNIGKIDKKYFKELLEKGFLVLEKGGGKKYSLENKRIFKEEIEKLPNKRSKGPVLMSICITSECNLRCRHCGNDSGLLSKSKLTFDEVKNIVDQASELSTMKLTITGGEPLLHKDFFSILDYCYEKIPRLGLTSNGFLINEKNIKKIKNKLDVLKISLDGLENFHDDFRGREGSFKRAINAIKKSVEEGIETRVQMTLTRENTSDVKQLIEKLNNLMVKRISIVPIVPTGRATCNMMLKPLEYRRFVLDLIDHIKNINLNSEIEIRPFFTLINNSTLKKPNIIGNKYHCEALRSSIDILPNGDVIPCSFLNKKIGNVKTERIEDIWNSKEAEEFRSQLDNVKNLSECKDCKFNNLCEGGCVATKLAISGVVGRDVYCWGCSK